MKKKNSVVHFEMPAKDKKRMSEFYSKVFGWETKMLGEDHGGYVLATTTDTGSDGRPKKPGAINGGFYTPEKEMTNEHPSVVIGVNDLKEAMDNIKKSGGKIVGEPMPVPGYGTYVSFHDTEGNRVGMMEPTEEMKEKD